MSQSGRGRGGKGKRGGESVKRPNTRSVKKKEIKGKIYKR